MAQVFITGGSGFIGQVLVRRLLATSHAVRVLVRSERAGRKVSALGAEPVRGDLTDATTWREAVTGSDVLFHLAAETDIDADRARHARVTVQGTAAALEAARYANIPRFVNCGSEAALLAGEPLVEADETAPLRPDSEAAYCAAKARAEKLVLDANAPAFATVSVRPRFVWGPDSILTSALASAAHAGQFAWIDGGHHKTDVTYVDNAVEGLILGWLRGQGGEAYFVTDQQRVTFRDFMQTMFDLYGVETPIPELDARSAAGSVPVPIRWFLGQTCTLRTDKARDHLGYKPLVSHSEGFESVRTWLTTATA